MQCKTCAYPLWNLKARQCPECGTAFRPDEFEFVINSVRYCCPHCEQSYYGTGDKGHLVPFEFNCVRCSRHVSMNDMVLRPAEGVHEQQTKVDRMPWLERAEIGRFKGWISTVGMALTAPGRLIRAVPDGASAWQAWLFAAVTGLAIAMCSVVPFMCLMMIPLFAGAGGSRPGAMIGGTGLGMLIGSGGFLVVMLLGTLIWGVVSHGLLLLTGKTSAGLGRSIQTICYSSGANAISAIPCFGGYFGWIWWTVSAVLMMRESQQVSGLRASFAVLTPPLLTVAGVIGFYIWIFYMVANAAAMQGGFNNNAFIHRAELQMVATSVVDYGTAHGGSGPGHATQLIQGASGLGASSFVATGTGTDDAMVLINGTSLNSLALLPANKLRLATQAAADALPKDVVAHRVGDYVFTYHGIDLQSAPASLWIVIFSPDPDAKPAVTVKTTFPGQQTPPPGLLVGLADGSTVPLTGSPAALLATQNQLRAGLGLPPLPDPGLVRHNAPTSASNPPLLPATTPADAAPTIDAPEEPAETP